MRSMPSVVLRVARAERAPLAVLALLVLIPAFLAAATPRELADRYDRGLRDAVVRSGGTELTVSGELRAPRDPRVGPLTDEGLRQAGQSWVNVTPAPLRAVTGPFGYEVHTPLLSIGYPPGRTPDLPGPSLDLTWNPQVARQIRYVSGSAPRNDPAGTGGRPVIEIALAAKAATRLGLRVGDVLPLSASAVRTPAVRVKGLYEPLSAADPFWRDQARLLAALDVQVGDATLTAATAVLDAAGYTVLYRATDLTLEYGWHFPVRLDKLAAADADTLTESLSELQFAVQNLRFGPTRLQFSTPLDSVLRNFSAQLRVTQAIVALALGGLAAVAVGVLALGCRVLTERMGTALSTMRARGASLAQLSVLTGGTTALAAVPAAAAGFALALLVAGPPKPLSLPGVLVVLAAALVVPVVLAAAEHRRTTGARRQDLTRAKPTARRLMLEGLVVVLAVIGMVVLRRRGLATEVATRGTDPFVVAAPILLATAAGLVLPRGYPYPLRIVGRLTRRRRSAVPFIGVAQASRQSLAAVLPMVVLLLATAVTGFAAAVDAAMSRAQESSAWHSVGADASVRGANLSPAAVDRIRAVPGVRDVLPVRVVEGASASVAGAAPEEVTVVGVDLSAYRRLVAGRPLPVPAAPVSAPRAGGAEPAALFSRTLAARIGSPQTTISWRGAPAPVPIRRAGTLDGFPTRPDGEALIVVPYAALGSVIQPTTVLVRGDHLDAGRLRQAAIGDVKGLSEVSVDTFARAHRELTGLPLVGVIRAAFGWTALGVAGYGTLTVLLALIIGAEARGRTVSYLRTLGLGRGQARGLALIEVGPAIACAAVAGWALGVVLPRLVGPAIDLRAYTAGFPAADYTPDLVWTALLVTGLVVVAGAAFAIDTALTARRRTDTALRMGDQP